MIYKLAPIVLFVLFSFKTNSKHKNFPISSDFKTVSTTPDSHKELVALYDNLNAQNFTHPSQESFINAIEGYRQLKKEGAIQKDIITLIDFSLSANQKRLWVIDLQKNSIIFQSLVAHGRNSGYEFATSFSNTPESHQSSLGFYATGETYYGKHGYSLRLDGLEKNINHNARKRAIVIHGASYVSDTFINQNGRLGRSFGCPALPKEQSKELINLIKDKSCLYIYYPDTL